MRKTLIGILGAMVMAGVAHAAASKEIVLDVKNMTCPACSITIEKALGHVAGVAQTKVDTKAGLVTVRFDPALTTAPALAHAVTDAGFPATPRPGGD